MVFLPLSLSSRRRLALVAAAALAAAGAGGCVTTTVTGPALPPPAVPPGAPTPEPAPPPPSSGGIFGPGGLFGDRNPTPETMATLQLDELGEQLGDDLRGTPVEIARPEPNLLRIAIPGHFCFDAGRSAVKQPLAAVLDRMALQLKAKTSLEVLLAGPADAQDSNTLLAADRAAAARDYLISKGLPAARFAVAERATLTGLEIRVAPRKGLRTGVQPARAPKPAPAAPAPVSSSR